MEADVVWLDEYERRARLVPGMVLIAPIAVVVVMFGLRDNPVVAAVLGGLTAFGAPVILANYVRHRGLAGQDHLWSAWGGPPATLLLQDAPTAQRARWRAAVECVSGQRLPDPGAADAGEYQTAVAVVISKTRAEKDRFPLVYAENCSYGYERNLYGLRRLGQAVSLICLAGAGLVVVVLATHWNRVMQSEWLIGLAALALLAASWSVLPSESRTRNAGYKYAAQLLDGAVELAGAEVSL